MLYIGNDLVSQPQSYRPAREPVDKTDFTSPQSLSRQDIVKAWLSPLNDKRERRSHLFVLPQRAFEGFRPFLSSYLLHTISTAMRSQHSPADSP